MSLRNFIKKKSYIDLDYVYSTLSDSNGENPLNYKYLIKNPMDVFIVATEANNAKAIYFNKNDMKQDDYTILKASSAIPLVCNPYYINDKAYFDGGISDPIPFQKAFELGCDKLVVILTKPKNYIRNPRQDIRIARLISKTYPNTAKKLAKRAYLYNKQLSILKKLEEENKIIIISPNDTAGVKTLTKNTNSLKTLYLKGYNDGKKVNSFLNM